MHEVSAGNMRRNFRRVISTFFLKKPGYPRVSYYTTPYGQIYSFVIEIHFIVLTTNKYLNAYYIYYITQAV